MSWSASRLGDVVTLKRGHDLPESQRQDGEVPVVSSSGITGRHNEPKAKPPGVVTGRYGTLGEVFYIEEEYWPLNTALYVTDFKGNHPRFVAYFLQNVLRNYHSEKAAVPGINRNVLHELKVRCPDTKTQECIADILSAYDDLIENNRRRMVLLEGAARQLYREWFVRLRFPGHEHTLITSGVPEGWERRDLEQCVSVLETGNRPKGGVSGISDGIPSIGAESIVGVGQFDFSETKYVPEAYFWKLKKGVVEDRDVLVYKDGGRPGHFTPHVSMFGGGFPFDRMALNSHVYRVRGTYGVTQEFLYYHLSFESILSWMNKAGSGAAIPGIARKDLLRLPVLVPSHHLMSLFTEVASNGVTQILKLALATKKLGEARDLLLPRLMSGEIAV